MELENLASTLALSFTGGVAFGHFEDNKFGVIKKIQKNTAKLKSKNSKKKVASPIASFNLKTISSTIAGITMSHLMHSYQDFAQGAILNGLAFYSGTFLGRAINRLSNRNKFYNLGDKKRIDEYINTIKEQDFNSDISQLLSTNAIRSGYSDIYKTNSLALADYFLSELDKATDYVLVHNFLEKKQKLVNHPTILNSITINQANNKEDIFYAYLIHDSSVIEAQYSPNNSIKNSAYKNSPDSFKETIDGEKIKIVNIFDFSLKKIDYSSNKDLANIILKKSEAFPVLVTKRSDAMPFDLMFQKIYESYLQSK